jgi:hypothetical protein
MGKANNKCFSDMKSNGCREQPSVSHGKEFTE